MDSTALEAILDVTLGMVFMWLILSIATMSIQEWIASYLKWRAKDLQVAIKRLLGNEVWAEKLYEHPLIRALSKEQGKKPSYIPANKFALALYDIVMTAGTPASIIQEKLLAAKHALDIAPNQIGPLFKHPFKRLRLSLSNFFIKTQYFLNQDKGTQKQRFDAILRQAEELFHSNAEEDKLEQEIKILQERIQSEKDYEQGYELENELKQVESKLRTIQVVALQKKLKKFILLLVNDQIEIEEGKVVPIPAVDFFLIYPLFQKFFFELLDQTNLRMQWAEDLINSNPEIIEEIIDALPENMTVRKGVRAKVEEKGQADHLDKQDLESLFNFMTEHYGIIDFAPMADYLAGMIGGLRGLSAISELNPSLHKSLELLYGDVIGIANNTQMMEAVRNKFAIAAIQLNKSEHNLAALRLNSETWFNESMDRLSGWYKRKAMVLAFLIGLVLTLLLNVDSIALAQHLWREPTVRKALAANATEFANENSEIPKVTIEDNTIDTPVEYFNAQFKDLNVPLGWEFTTIELKAGQTCKWIPIGPNTIWGIKTEVPKAELGENVENDSAAEIDAPQAELVPACQVISNFPNSTTEYLLKFLGIVFSAAAAAQGSPFWFDILKKVVNIRGSGVNPDEKK